MNLRKRNKIIIRMINKRLLIKNLLSHNDENSFYDKKLKLSLGGKEGKAKFLKTRLCFIKLKPREAIHTSLLVSKTKRIESYWSRFL